MNEDKLRCPELKVVRAGDETYAWCNLSDHPCMVEYDKAECEIYDEWLNEYQAEFDSRQAEKQAEKKEK